MTAGTLDGAVVSQGGREWILHEDCDDDGRRFGWSECGDCGGTVGMGDDARADHVCPPPDVSDAFDPDDNKLVCDCLGDAFVITRQADDSLHIQCLTCRAVVLRLGVWEPTR